MTKKLKAVPAPKARKAHIKMTPDLAREARKLLKRKGANMHNVADKLGVSYSAIYRVTGGRRACLAGATAPQPRAKKQAEPRKRAA